MLQHGPLGSLHCSDHGTRIRRLVATQRGHRPRPVTCNTVHLVHRVATQSTWFTALQLLADREERVATQSTWFTALQRPRPGLAQTRDPAATRSTWFTALQEARGIGSRSQSHPLCSLQHGPPGKPHCKLMRLPAPKHHGRRVAARSTWETTLQDRVAGR
jgi:hypothetical protein